MKQFALCGADGEVIGMANTREEIEAAINDDPLFSPFSSMTDIVEFEYNDAPITSLGEEYKEKIRLLFEERNVSYFRFSKQIGFYEMHIDDRFKYIYDILTEAYEPVESLDKHVELNRQDNQ